MLNHYLEPCRIPILETMVDENTPERKTNTQNNLQKHLIPQKETFSKNIKNPNFFDVFNNKGISKLSLEAQDVHYDSPTGFHITETKDPKSKHKVF